MKDAASDGEFLAKVIVEKLQRSSCSVSFADIAKQAVNNKKPALAALVSSHAIHVVALFVLIMAMHQQCASMYNFIAIK